MTHSFLLAVVFMSLPGLLDYLWFGPTFAALQSMVRPRTRAMVVALQLFMTNLIGLASARWPPASPATSSPTSCAWARPRGCGPR